VRLVWLALSTVVALLFFVTRAEALAVPKLEGRVNDYADVLSPDAEQRINRTLEAHEKATGQQFAVLTIKSLEGDPLEDFSIRTVEAWKLGREKQDDGLLLLVVKDDRKVRIEVGHGLEGSITDALSSRVIRSVIVPSFKTGDYARGIEGALNVLIRHETGGATELAEPPTPRQGSRKVSPLFALLLFVVPFLIPFFILSRMSGGRGRWGRSGGFYGGYGGWGGGGGFGGGFGGSSGGFSGGGGSFGGGGASGSW
jgi:uncharacterized protein